jgi:hypothetical protein
MAAKAGAGAGIFREFFSGHPILATFLVKNGGSEQESAMTKPQSGSPTRPAAALLQAVVAGTPIQTLEGALPVEFLQPGDRVLTRSGMRRLREVQVSLVKNARMVRIAHETLGVDRPSHDILVSAGQLVLVRDWRAQALAGVPAALFPAARLADGEYIRCLTLPEARLFTLVFEEEAIVYAGGLELVCPAMAEA